MIMIKTFVEIQKLTQTNLTSVLDSLRTLIRFLSAYSSPAVVYDPPIRWRFGQLVNKLHW